VVDAFLARVRSKCIPCTTRERKKKKKTTCTDCVFYRALFVMYSALLKNYIPVYSGGRDQEDHGLKPAQQTVHETLSYKTLHKRYSAGGVAQGDGPEFKPQYCKKNETQSTQKPYPCKWTF
jgi:hypothetical protein